MSANPKFNTHVMIMFPEEKPGTATFKYVTSVERSYANWDPGQPAMELSEEFARDIVYGLTINGYIAMVVKVVKGVELRNPEASTK